MTIGRMANISDVEPVIPPAQPDATQPPAAPAPEPEETEAPQGELPPALIKIPAFQAVLSGSPPAVSMNLKGADDRAEVKLLAENKQALLDAGLMFYRSLSGQRGVMFNAMRIHPQDIQAADKAGKLLAVAPDFDLVNHEVAKLGLKHPVYNAQAPTGLASPVSTAPPQAQSGQLSLMPPPAAAVQRKLAQQRIMSAQPGAPTSGPAPGAGRLLNQVLKPVI